MYIEEQHNFQNGKKKWKNSNTTSLWVILSTSILGLEDTFFLDTTQSTDAAASAENPIPGPHQTSWKSTQVAEEEEEEESLLFLCFFFLVFFPWWGQSADARITAGTDTCWEAPAVHPKPLKVAAADEKLIFLLMGCCEDGVSLERSRDEIVDLQRVDWICFVLGSVSVSEMGLLLIWFLGGFLHFICCCSVFVFVSCVTEDMLCLVWFGLVGEESTQE